MKPTIFPSVLPASAVQALAADEPDTRAKPAPAIQSLIQRVMKTADHDADGRFTLDECKPHDVRALGRSLAWTDQAEVARLKTSFASSGYKLDALITEIALSMPFRTK